MTFSLINSLGSKISPFQKMSQKLDAGWKMTDANCEKCKFTILMDPSTSKGHCLKCGEAFDGMFEDAPEEKETRRQEAPSENKKDHSKAGDPKQGDAKNAKKNKEQQKSKNQDVLDLSEEEEEVKQKAKKGKKLLE